MTSRKPPTFAEIDGNRVRVRSVKVTRVPFIPQGAEMVPASRKDAKNVRDAITVTTVTAFFATNVRGGCRYRITQTATGTERGLLAFAGSRLAFGKWNNERTTIEFDTFI